MKNNRAFTRIVAALLCLFVFTSIPAQAKATATPGASTSATANKSKNATVIKLGKKAYTVAGFKVTLKPKLVKKNESLTGLKWKSSNKKIAKVNSKGVVTGVKAGKCNVTCTLANGKTYTTQIIVRENKFTGKTKSKINVNDYTYGKPYLELSSLYYKKGKLVAKMTVVNNSMFKVQKFSKMTVAIVDGNGQTIARQTFKDVSVNAPAYGKKLVTFTFTGSGIAQKKAKLYQQPLLWAYNGEYIYLVK